MFLPFSQKPYVSVPLCCECRWRSLRDVGLPFPSLSHATTKGYRLGGLGGRVKHRLSSDVSNVHVQVKVRLPMHIV